MNLLFILLRILPLEVIAVVGNSMKPAYQVNQRLLVLNVLLTQLHVGDVVVFYESSRSLLLIKRVTKIKGNHFFLEGDNRSESTDSNQFGWIDKKDILAKVIYPKRRYNN